MRTITLQTVLSITAFLIGPALSLAWEASDPTGESRTNGVDPRALAQRLDALKGDLSQLISAPDIEKGEEPEKNPFVPVADTRALDRKKDLEDLLVRIKKLEEAIEELNKKLSPRHETRLVRDGLLVINNWSGARQDVVVNHVLHSIPPGTTSLWVRYDLVEAYVSFWEAPKFWGMSNWKWNGQYHTMTIEVHRRI